MNKYKCIILKKTVYNHANTANIAPPPLLDDKNTKGRKDILLLGRKHKELLSRTKITWSLFCLPKPLNGSKMNSFRVENLAKQYESQKTGP